MTRHRFAQSRRERAQALVGALAINLSLGAAFVAGIAMRAEKRGETATEMFDVALPPPPPPAVDPPRRKDAPDKPQGAVGKKAEASPFIATPAVLPTPSPVVAATVPAQGSAAASGAATSGSGTGAGGSGSGAGGGGGIGSEARLLGGNRARLPRALLRSIPQDDGYAHLLLTIGIAGRVTNCRVLTSSGYAAIDAALCDVMTTRSRWTPARDRSGRPIPVDLRYTGTWTKR